jgi:TonB family protein
MNDPASDVIAARGRGQGTLRPPLVWSLAAHAAIVAAIWLAPGRRADDVPRLVMTVNLGGAPGPRSGGLTQMGGRAVPEPPPDAPRPAPRTPPPPPPAAPAPRAATLPAPKPAPTRPSRTESPRTRPAPAAQEEPREGNTRVETGARGQGFGLATGGNGAKGIELEVSDFCCPGYLEQVRIAIERGWERTPGVAGVTIMRFRILRNGAIDMVSVVQSSNNPLLDAAAARAVARVPNLPPLPAEFRESSLALRMRFENRRSGEY